LKDCGLPVPAPRHDEARKRLLVDHTLQRGLAPALATLIYSYRPVPILRALFWAHSAVVAVAAVAGR